MLSIYVLFSVWNDESDGLRRLEDGTFLEIKLSTVL